MFNESKVCINHQAPSASQRSVTSPDLRGPMGLLPRPAIGDESGAILGLRGRKATGPIRRSYWKWEFIVNSQTNIENYNL